MFVVLDDKICKFAGCAPLLPSNFSLILRLHDLHDHELEPVQSARLLAHQPFGQLFLIFEVGGARRLTFRAARGSLGSRLFQLLRCELGLKGLVGLHKGRRGLDLF